MKMAKPEISIVIITKNDPGVAMTLNALITIKRPSPIEIIVVDASNPVTALDAIRLNHKEAEWLHYDGSKQQRYTFSQQRNAGVKRARGKYIVFLDCDCLPAKDWLEVLYAALQKHPGSLIASNLLAVESSSAFALCSPKELTKVSESPANGLAMERSLFDEIGLFDEALTFGEDTDITWRARLAGHNIFRDGRATISHDWGSKKADMKRAFRYGAARAKLYKKHHELRAQLLGHDVNVLIYSLYLIFLPVTLLAFWWWPFLLYPFALLPLILKNIRTKPLLIIGTNLVYGAGVIYGVVKRGLAV